MNRELIQAYLSLSKPRIGTMVLVTTALGYVLGAQNGIHWGILLLTLLGSVLTCAGSAALNCYIERDSDKYMSRTSARPLPSGVLPASNALSYGVLMILCGTCTLALGVNLLTAFLALLTAFLYVLVYTPLKRVTWLNTFIGAIPGALPPVGGWTAATGSLSIEALALFAILFVWQHPHFYAIAWIYRDDYRQGGMQMLPVIDPEGRRTFRQVMIYSVLLIIVSVLPVYLGLSGPLYLFGALALSLGFLVSASIVSFSRTTEAARGLLHASLVYLPGLFLVIIADRSLW